MTKKIGIPRGLFYYQYYPLWRTFFEELGAELVVSDPTTKRILDDGVKNCVDEACLPVKLFHGHVLNLKDKVDYLFIPRFTSISKNEYVCPKFGGLPDMVRHTLKDLPEIIDTEVNLRKSKQNAYKAALDTGSYFTEDERKIRKAYKKALGNYRLYKEQIRKGELPCDLLERFKSSPPSVFSHSTGGTAKDKGSEASRKNPGNTLNIALIGHVYNLYDRYINMDMLKKLKSMDVNIITVDMLDGKIINKKSALLPKRMFWYFGRKAIGGAYHILDREDMDGIIYVMSFGCGVDSFVADLIERKVKRSRDIPFMVLTIDEHSGEAGMNTRLEAFIDMIKWRKKDEADISALG